VGWPRSAVRFPATATTPDLAFTGMRSVRACRGYAGMRDPLRLHHRCALVAAGAALVAARCRRAAARRDIQPDHRRVVRLDDLSIHRRMPAMIIVGTEISLINARRKRLTTGYCALRETRRKRYAGLGVPCCTERFVCGRRTIRRRRNAAKRAPGYSQSPVPTVALSCPDQGDQITLLNVFNAMSRLKHPSNEQRYRRENSHAVAAVRPRRLLAYS